MSSVLNRKYHKYSLYVSAVVLFGLMTIKQLVFDIPGMARFEVLGTVILMIYGFLTFLLLFNNSLVEKLIWLGVYNFVLMIMEVVTVILVSLLLKKSLTEVSSYDQLGSISFLLGKILTLLLFELIIRKHNHRFIIGFTYTKELTAIIIFNAILGLGAVFILTDKNHTIDNINYVILFFLGIVLLITFYTSVLIFRIERKTNEEMETKLKLHQIEMELKLDKDIISVTHNLRKLRHDMNNHIGLIKMLVNTNKYGELKEYLNQIYEDVDAANELVLTDNNALSIILNIKKSLAKEKGIDFTSIITAGEIGMQSKDLSALLGNLLDNAIEAAEKSEGKKYIELNIIRTEEGCVISCENSLGLKPVKVNGKFMSTKDNAHIHGMGTENMKDIAAKYNGKIQFNYDDELFNTRIVMPV